jgi:Protein of unknown function (DUF742)
MPSSGEMWVDADAGPVVRPYAVISGRTRPGGDSLDLIAMITSTRRPPPDPWTLGPEHHTVLRICRAPASVADLASDLDLPLGVVRILLADLRDRGLIAVHQPRAAQPGDLSILKEVVDGLRRL